MAFTIPYPEGVISLSTDRVSKKDAIRQERTAKEIVQRLEHQPGLILADEVGMGKTFVALAAASAIAWFARKTGRCSLKNASTANSAAIWMRRLRIQELRFCDCWTTRPTSAKRSFF
jgi:hypothetical protein